MATDVNALQPEAMWRRVGLRLDCWLSRGMSAVVLGGMAAGWFFPALASGKPWIICAFAYMTLAGALGVSPRELATVVRRPLAVLVIFLALHAVMPILVFLIGRLAFAGAPHIVAGLILGVAAPTAVTSVMWASMTGGDLPVAVAVVTVDSLLSPFVVPATVAWLAGAHVAFDPAALMRGLLLMLVIPTLIGVGLNGRTRGRILGWVKPATGWSSKLALSFVVAVNTAAARPELIAGAHLLAPLFGLLILFAVSGYVVGIGAARLLGWEPRTAVTAGYSAGMRNISSAIVVAATYFPPAVVQPIVLSMLFQQPIASLVDRYWQRRRSATGES